MFVYIIVREWVLVNDYFLGGQIVYNIKTVRKRGHNAGAHKVRPYIHYGKQYRGDMERNQFTFYRSFWEAVKGVPKRDRLPILEAIIGYALDESEPEGLSSFQAAFFLLVRPNLDASRKRAAGGKNGGSLSQANRKLRASLAEASVKASAREKENEKEIEKENEIEGEVDKQHPLHERELFYDFWASYPVKIGQDMAAQAWDGLKLSQEEIWQLMDGLTLWKNSLRWAEKGGKFIPRAARWLSEKHYLEPPKEDTVPKGASGVLGQAEWEAIERVLREE